MKLISLINTVVEKLEKWIIAWSVIFMAALLIGNVLMRVVFHDSLASSEEVGRFLLITMTFIGSAYAARIGRHIRMSAIYDMLSLRLRRTLMTIISLSTGLALLVVSYYCVQYVLFLFESGRVSNSLGIPMYLFMFFVPVGMFLMSLQYLSTAIVNLVKKDAAYVSPLKKDTEADQADETYVA
ncbi:TRAP transporter small permease [Brevibacillus marinus]|uniref:TRAP transporter small permease n=1 Tax=Brevibacillus marinus TaxID=2496837 RepID=UPI000F84C977|nr:TRAP transporter small permease [Brevibacillus marinus]